MSDQIEKVHTIEDEAERRMALVDMAVKTYGDYLLNYLLNLTKNRADAEDLFQDLICHVMEYFADDKITHVGFLRRKAYQMFCDRWRRHVRNPVNLNDQPPEIQVAAFQEPLNDEEEQRFKARFFEEYRFLGLTPEQEDALWYHCRNQCSYREIAVIMNIPPSTVGDWITKARQLFIEHLNVDR